MLGDAGNLVLLFVHLLAVCVWVGGFVTIAVVTRVVRCELPVAARVAFFRSLGRSYALWEGPRSGSPCLAGVDSCRGVDGTNGPWSSSCWRSHW
jgi:hypothetical protein